MKLNIIIIFLLYSLVSKGQDSTCIIKLSNAKITFTLLRYGMDFTETTPPKAEVVIKTSVKSTALWKQLKVLSPSQWQCLLDNPKTDWAANLILYQLYEKDAILYKKIKNRNDWLKTKKDEDIAYWKKKLK